MDIAATLESPTRSKPHFIALGILWVVVAALAVLVWVHPTVGYAQGGYLNGADLRSGLIILLGCLFAAFAVASTLVISLLPRRLHAAIRYGASYAVGLGAALAVIPIFDKYF